MSEQLLHRERCMQATTVPDRCCLVNPLCRVQPRRGAPPPAEDVDCHSRQVGGVTWEMTL